MGHATMDALPSNLERTNKPISHEDTNNGGQLNKGLHLYNIVVQIYLLEKRSFIFFVVGM
jgi:hypothetical protein